MMLPAGTLAMAAQQVDQTDYAPGLVAFIVIFVIAIITWLLFRSMTRHIRRAKANEAAMAGPGDSREANGAASPGADGASGQP